LEKGSVLSWMPLKESPDGLGGQRGSQSFPELESEGVYRDQREVLSTESPVPNIAPVEKGVAKKKIKNPIVGKGCFRKGAELLRNGMHRRRE